MILALCGSLAAALFLIGALRVHGMLAWAVCAPLVLASRRAQGWWGACAVGAVFGAAVAVGGSVPWVAAASVTYFALPRWLALATSGVLGLLCGGGFGAVLGAGLRCAVHRSAGGVILMVGAVWAAWESLTTSVFPYYPWVALAATQAELPALLQSASVVGHSGLSCAIAAAGTAFGLACRPALRSPRERARLVLTAAAIMALLTAFGILRLRLSGPPPEHVCAISTVDARIASAGAPAQTVFARYQAMSRRIVPSHPDAIIWPESALPGSPELDATLQRHLRQLTRDWDTVLITGGPRIRWGSGWRQRLFNSVYRIDAAAPLQAYDKRALVPFAEYWPGPLSVRPKWLEAAAVTPGTQPALFNAGGCRLGMLICFEAERPDLAREAVRSGADALLVVSNDADLPLPAVRREIAQARLRAVETGVPVVRAANRGISVVIDRYGRVLQDGSGKVLHAAISPGRPALAVNIQPLLLALFWITTGLAILHRLLRLRRLC